MIGLCIANLDLVVDKWVTSAVRSLSAFDRTQNKTITSMQIFRNFFLLIQSSRGARRGDTLKRL